MSQSEFNPLPEAPGAESAAQVDQLLPPPLPKQPSPFAAVPATLKRVPKLLWIGLGIGFVAGILVSLAVSGISSLVGSVTASHAITDAVKSCGADGKDGISVGDKGDSVTINTKGKTDSSGASYTDAACILKALKIPDSVVSQIDSTNALQGRQSADWDNLTASWSYHPDSGLNMIVKIATK